MTQSLTTNHLDRNFSVSPTDHHDGGRMPINEDLVELLDQVCHSALRMAAGVAHAPRVLRVRAGEVTIEVEWPTDVSDPAVVPPGRRAPGDPVSASAEPDVAERLLTAPTVGVFYTAPEPGAAPFLREGDVVVVGQQIGIVEAMKLMVPVHAEIAGRVVRALKGNAEPVEYGEPLFALAAADVD